MLQRKDGNIWYLSLPWGPWWWLSALCLLSPLELCFPSTSDNHVCQWHGSLVYISTGGQKLDVDNDWDLVVPSLPHFCGFRSAVSPCYKWSLIFWAAGCWGLPSEDSSHTRPSSCSEHLWRKHTSKQAKLIEQTDGDKQFEGHKSETGSWMEISDSDII